MRKKLNWAIIASCLVVLTGLVYASMTGVISGKIVDNAGNPVPGVTVSVMGLNLQGSRTDFSNDNGVFRIPELAPGEYTVTADMMGLKTIERTGVKVSINRTTKVDITMQVADVVEVVTVTAKAPLIDTATTTKTITVERDFTDRLPGANDSYQDAFAISGSLNGGGNPRVSGGSEMDNLYLMDGLDTTDPVTGTFGSNINADAIEEVEIQTGGFQAEYGRALGGILNAVTKSGGNQFGGSIRLKYVNSDWMEDFDPGKERAVRDREYWEPTATLGGPIVKDMLWFFLTYKRTDIDSTYQVISDAWTPFEDGNPIEFRSADSSSIWEEPFAKLTFQPNSQHKFVAKFNQSNAVIHGESGEDLAVPEAQSKQEQGGPYYGVDWTYLYSSNLFINSQIGFSRSFIYVLPESEDETTPSWENNQTGVIFGNWNRWYKEDRDRTSFVLSANYFADDFHGSHDFKSGLEWQYLKVDAEDRYPGGSRYTFNLRDGDDYFTQREDQLGGTRQEYNGTYYAWYLQDAWEYSDKLVINPGIRYEYMRFENDAGEEAGKFDMMLAPRLGLAYDIEGNGQQKVNFYVGRYYNPLDLQLPAMLVREATSYERYRRKQTGEWTNEDDFQSWSGDWEFDSRIGGEVNLNRIDPDLKPEHSDEIQIGYERALTPSIGLGVTGTYRATRDIVEDVGFMVDENGDEVPWEDVLADLPYWKANGTLFYEVTNPEGAKRDYWGVELFAKVQTDKLTLMSSYTYSRTKGTVIGTQPGSEGQGVSHFSVYYDTPDLSKGLFGPLYWDSPHYFKLNLAYQIPYGFTVGSTAFYRSGYAYSKRTQQGDGLYPGRYALAEEGRGSYRYPDVINVDLSLQWEYNFGNYGTMTLIGDIFNVLDDQVVVRRNEEYNPNKPELFDQDTQWAAPRDYRVSIKYAF